MCRGIMFYAVNNRPGLSIQSFLRIVFRRRAPPDRPEKHLEQIPSHSAIFSPHLFKEDIVAENKLIAYPNSMR